MSKLPQLISAIASKNDPEMVKLINDMTIDQVNALHTGYLLNSQQQRIPGDTLGATALHVACLSNNTTAIAVLLGLKGIEVNTKMTANYGTNWSLFRLLTDGLVVSLHIPVKFGLELFCIFLS